ncbi:uncharacterized protein LACBIDRAFT_318200 [Laccaria bicolor S238N-H82]|uniref:Predicted protein n=1 Tax=Laccaria bicolor (strain S238N-H82 / ATCC MYA-4686) TaxID=486041 RepID=B0D672_LACBS|nr:uncharacterized protein LACBIDRAFT_318200 [Laccaria bicolor S238N-H82]EDR09893.1 predicted protein [Laccaria bicolor S238N-H82]|eukprot:XP_001879278.1 predicted protein [Laccaria bicolor S238N-H82]
MAGLTAGLKIEVLSKSWECNTKLNTLTDARAWSEEHRYVQLSEYDDDELIRDQFCVKKKGRYSYVVWKKEAGQPEVVLNISGFVVSSFFGPINRHVNLRITRQNITIVGLGNPAFNSALSVLRRIYRLLDQSHPIGAMQPFRSTKVLDTPAFTAEARFLTSIEDVEAFATDGYSLRHSQDPQHILQSCVGSGKFAYTEDNHVELSELGDADPDTGIQFPNNIDNPCYIRPGDLVELSFTLRSITLGKVQTKEAFVTKLDAVVIIDKFGAKLLYDRDCQDDEARRAEAARLEKSKDVSAPKKLRVGSSVKLSDYVDQFLEVGRGKDLDEVWDKESDEVGQKEQGDVGENSAMLT